MTLALSDPAALVTVQRYFPPLEALFMLTFSAGVIAISAPPGSRVHENELFGPPIARHVSISMLPILVFIPAGMIATLPKGET